MARTAAPTGRTRVLAVIGDPVAHSLSPVIHNAAFAALGLDWVYVALPVPPGSGGDAVRSLRHIGLAGLNVTAPHKEVAAAACDELSDEAAILRSVNTVVVRGDGALYGASTDGQGFLDSLAEEAIDCRGARALVLGGGGAARSVVLALVRAGAEVAVSARDPRRAAAAGELAGGGPILGLGEAARSLGDFTMVVQATSVGMGGEAAVLDASLLGPEHVAIDLVYHPVETTFLRAAGASGARIVGGIGMLVHQAAHSFQMWTGREAPVAVMRAAARDALVPAREGG